MVERPEIHDSRRPPVIASEARQSHNGYGPDRDRQEHWGLCPQTPDAEVMIVILTPFIPLMLRGRFVGGDKPRPYDEEHPASLREAEGDEAI